MITSGSKFGELLADSVFALADEQTAKDVEVAKHWDVDPPRFIRERLYLHMWCVELAVTRAVGSESAHRARVLGGFFRQSEVIAARMKWTSLLSDAATRAESYSEAYNYPHKLGIPYTVGAAFALACNSEMDAALILLGAKYFEGYESHTEDLVRIWRRDHS